MDTTRCSGRTVFASAIGPCRHHSNPRISARLQRCRRGRSFARSIPSFQQRGQRVPHCQPYEPPSPSPHTAARGAGLDRRGGLGMVTGDASGRAIRLTADRHALRVDPATPRSILRPSLIRRIASRWRSPLRWPAAPADQVRQAVALCGDISPTRVTTAPAGGLAPTTPLTRAELRHLDRHPTGSPVTSDRRRSARTDTQVGPTSLRRPRLTTWRQAMHGLELAALVQATCPSLSRTLLIVRNTPPDRGRRPRNSADTS